MLKTGNSVIDDLIEATEHDKWPTTHVCLVELLVIELAKKNETIEALTPKQD